MAINHTVRNIIGETQVPFVLSPYAIESITTTRGMRFQYDASPADPLQNTIKQGALVYKSGGQAHRVLYGAGTGDTTAADILAGGGLMVVKKVVSYEGVDYGNTLTTSTAEFLPTLELETIKNHEFYEDKLSVLVIGTPYVETAFDAAVHLSHELATLIHVSKDTDPKTVIFK